jgi:glycosyltransferase involved in cell wall biosynthesis
MKSFSQVFVFIHDGFYCAHTGAGISNNRFINTIYNLGHHGQFYICPVYTSEDNPDFQNDYFRNNSKKAVESGAIIIPIENGSNGYVRWGNHLYWEKSALSAMTIINKFLDKNGEAIVFSLDSPFIGLLRERLPSNVLHIHTPHGTGKIHEPFNWERIQFEEKCLRNAKNDKVIIAATNDYMMNHLVSDYGVENNRIKLLRNGILANEYKSVSEQRLKETLEKFGIPRDTPFLLAYGRAQYYKGFHILLDALKILGKHAPLTVIIATTTKKGDQYIEMLRKKILLAKLPVKLSCEFSLEDPRILQACKNLIAVVVPSLREPFGLVPIEVMGNPNTLAPIIASYVDGIKEEIENEHSGFVFEPGNAIDLARVLNQVMKISINTRHKIKTAGQTIVTSKYNYENNIRTFLNEL